MESQELPSEDGEKQERLISSPHQEECIFIESIKSLICLENVMKTRKIEEQESVMQEFPVTIKEEIWEDKLNILDQHIQDMKLSLTSDQESTSKGKGFSPFWTNALEEKSQKLWLPIKTDLQESDLNSWNTSSKRLLQNSWFSTKIYKLKNKNSQKISLPSLQSLSQETTEDVHKSIKKSEKKDLEMTTTKWRIYPNQKQIHKLRKWFGCYRKTYNMAVAHLKANPGDLKAKILRDLFVSDNAVIGTDLEYLLETPHDVRNNAIRDLITNYQTCFKKYQKDKIPFDFKFKSKKDGDAISIRARCIVKRNEKGEVKKPSKKRNKPRAPGFYKFIRNIIPQKVKDCLCSDFEIVRTKTNKYFICFPNHVEYCSKLPSGDGIASLDPGVRTFQTVYDTNGRIIEIGNGDIKKVSEWKSNAEKLEAELKDVEKYNRRKRKHLKRAALRLREKIQNRINDLHHKVSKFLVTEYDSVLLPEFPVSQMVKKQDQNKIGKQTRKDLLSFKHYQFKQMMKYKHCTTEDTKLFITNESYTTITCGKCGKLKRIGASKEYSCNHCKSQFDRDHNGARNNLLKFLGESGAYTLVRKGKLSL